MRFLFGVLAALALTASASWGSSISLFSDLAGSSCNLSIPLGGTGTFYVIAVDAEHSGTPCDPHGLSGAGFSIGGLPAGWTTTVHLAPGANVMFGNPFVTDVHVAFPDVQFSYLVPLLVITVTPAGPVSSATLTVGPSLDPEPWNCRLIMGSGWCAIDPDAACVSGGSLYINEPGNCLVPVAAVNWSALKRLYE